MKQLMIIEIVNNEDKHMSKAKTTAIGVAGVKSVAEIGQNKNRLAVVGYGVDAVKLINLLRKRLKHVELVSVTSAEGDFFDDSIVTAPEVQHPTYYRRPSYQAVVPYDVHGYRPNYSDYPQYRANYYDNYGHRSHDPDNCTIM